MPCTNCGEDGKVYIADGDGISFTGAGTKSSPFRPHLAQEAGSLLLEVRDSATVNFTLFGTGLPGDPLVLSADTSSASKLANLADVAASPAPTQGRVPMWIGSQLGGRFEFRQPGTRYTTHAARGDGLYQGEQIKEVDTGERLEWDGSQYVSLNPTTVPASALDPTVLQNGGTIDGSVDWNTLVSASRIYRVQAGINSTNASPNGAYSYGTLVVVRSGNSVTQTYYTHAYPNIYSRTKWNDTDFTPWLQVATAATLGDEINARSNADISLRQSINDEANARNGGDSNLQNLLNNEASARSGQDSALFNDYQAKFSGVYQAYDGGRLDGRYPRNISGVTMIQRGELVVTDFGLDSDSGKYVGRANIGYGAFNNAPSLVGSAQSNDAGGVTVQFNNRSATGATVVVSRRNKFDTGVTWIAAGS